MPVVLEVQRTIKMARIWALYMALCKLRGPPEMFTDNRGVVQAKSKAKLIGSVLVRRSGYLDSALE